MRAVEYIGTLPDEAIAILANLVQAGTVEKLIVEPADEEAA